MQLKNCLLAASLIIGLFSVSVRADNAGVKDGSTLKELTADIDADGKADVTTITLTSFDDQEAGVSICLGNGNTVSNPKLLWVSPQTFDTTAELVEAKISAKGSLVISSGKDWGTSMFYNKLYIAARRGQLVIAGFTYVASYRGELDMSCDLNFLTGTGVVNGHKVRVSKAGRGFAQTTELALTQECGDIAVKLAK